MKDTASSQEGTSWKEKLQMEVLDIIRSPGSSTPSSSDPAQSKRNSLVQSTTASPDTKFTERTHISNEGSIPIKIVIECSYLYKLDTIKTKWSYLLSSGTTNIVKIDTAITKPLGPKGSPPE